MKKLQPTEYTYASARIRSLENRIVGRERMEILIESRSVEEALDRLAEYGYAPSEEDAAVTAEKAASATREAILLSVLGEAFREVEQALPDPALFRYFRYPYDCNNIKAAIKCAVRGISAEDMLFDFGTVPADEVETALSVLKANGEGRATGSFSVSLDWAGDERTLAFCAVATSEKTGARWMSNVKTYDAE